MTQIFKVARGSGNYITCTDTVKEAKLLILHISEYLVSDIHEHILARLLHTYYLEHMQTCLYQNYDAHKSKDIQKQICLSTADDIIDEDFFEIGIDSDDSGGQHGYYKSENEN